jgi:hypothetical protein
MFVVAQRYKHVDDAGLGFRMKEPEEQADEEKGAHGKGMHRWHCRNAMTASIVC